jgi:putative phosphoribosyl transferase
MRATGVSPSILNHRVSVQVGTATLTLTVTLPSEPRALVLVPSASGDRTYEGVNRAVTCALWEAGFATVEADLLTPSEAAEDAETSAFRFDLDLIAERTAAVLEWAHGVPALRTLEAGIFAAGTCAAGALVAAADRPELIQSVVCRSARPELARRALAYVHAPVLLVLGQRDLAHRDTHETAMTLLPPRSRLEVVPNARHLLDRPEDVRRVATLAIDWLRDSLTSRWVIAGMWLGPGRSLVAR